MPSLSRYLRLSADSRADAASMDESLESNIVLYRSRAVWSILKAPIKSAINATATILNLLANETFRSATMVRAAAIRSPARDAVLTDSARESRATPASGIFHTILTREISKSMNGRPNMMWNAASFEFPRLPTEVIRSPTIRFVTAIMTAEAAAAQPNTANVRLESEKSVVRPTMMK